MMESEVNLLPSTVDPRAPIGADITYSRSVCIVKTVRDLLTGGPYNL